MIFLFQGCILRFHVNLPGCTPFLPFSHNHWFSGKLPPKWKEATIGDTPLFFTKNHDYGRKGTVNFREARETLVQRPLVSMVLPKKNVLLTLPGDFLKKLLGKTGGTERWVKASKLQGSKVLLSVFLGKAREGLMFFRQRSGVWVVWAMILRSLGRWGFFLGELGELESMHCLPCSLLSLAKGPQNLHRINE